MKSNYKSRYTCSKHNVEVSVVANILCILRASTQSLLFFNSYKHNGI